MDSSWLTGLKYFTWLLTVGTAFVGSWFVDFTKTDEETNRKKLTVWGRRGVWLAAVGLALSLTLTIAEDVQTASKERESQKRAAEERQTALAFQQRSENALADIAKLVSLINSAGLSREDRTRVQEAVGSLNGLEDYRKNFPDLYQRLIQATTFQEVAPVIEEGLNRAVSSRILNRPECAKVPRPGKEPRSGFPGGHFLVSGSSGFTYMITPSGVQFEYTDASDLKSLGDNGYRLLFSDGTQSPQLACKSRKSGMSCADVTSDVDAKKVYVDMQQKTISAVQSGAKRHELAKETAEAIRTTFSCIIP